MHSASRSATLPQAPYLLLSWAAWARCSRALLAKLPSVGLRLGPGARYFASCDGVEGTAGCIRSRQSAPMVAAIGDHRLPCSLAGAAHPGASRLARGRHQRSRDPGLRGRVCGLGEDRPPARCDRPLAVTPGHLADLSPPASWSAPRPCEWPPGQGWRNHRVAAPARAALRRRLRAGHW
jgi:hypothetical protein